MNLYVKNRMVTIYEVEILEQQIENTQWRACVCGCVWGGVQP